MQPELISFKLCPFVQRSVIVLLEKGVEFDITYIDLEKPPEWFLAISPMGKVPALRIGNTALFESAVIMEYLDEVNPPSLHPADPLRKAQHRAWVEYASELLFSQYRMSIASTEADFEAERQRLRDGLERLEQQVEGPFFGGSGFRLVDAAYAPLFMRQELLDQWHPSGVLDGLKRLGEWRDALRERPSVTDSVVSDLPELLREYVTRGDGYAASLYRAGTGGG